MLTFLILRQLIKLLTRARGVCYLVNDVRIIKDRLLSTLYTFISAMFANESQTIRCKPGVNKQAINNLNQ